MSETYISNARDAVIAYFGRNASGNLRCYCVRCSDAEPLSDASRVYGDLHQPEPLTHGRGSYGADDTCDQCEVCWTSLLSLSLSCQREHDDQQVRWARQPVLALVEYGIPTAVRCRVY